MKALGIIDSQYACIAKNIKYQRTFIYLNSINTMKSKLFLIIIIINLLSFLFSNSAQAQSEESKFTFRAADVKIAESLIEEISYEKAIKSIVKGAESYPTINKNIVQAKMHAFVDAVGRAYSEHRPLVISPDMIWLLICQGFSKHVNSIPEQLRYQFVTHKGKKELIVDVTPFDFKKGKSDNPYHLVFPQFAHQIKQHTLGELYDVITAPFSTTGIVEKAAFEITLMDAMKAYFKYELRFICGIPSITLEGTVEDWLAVLFRAKKLAKYQLKWWIDALIPILEEFVKTRQGNVNLSFWNNIYNYHVPKGKWSLRCPPPPKPYVNGWIIKFFPILPNGLKNIYLKENKNLLTVLKENDLEIDDFPNGLEINEFTTGISKTEFIWNDLVRNEKYDMELLAGFIGIRQDKATKALRPEIGWAVREVKPKASPKNPVRNQRE